MCANRHYRYAVITHRSGCKSRHQDALRPSPRPRGDIGYMVTIRLSLCQHKQLGNNDIPKSLARGYVDQRNEAGKMIVVVTPG